MDGLPVGYVLLPGFSIAHPHPPCFCIFTVCQRPDRPSVYCSNGPSFCGVMVLLEGPLPSLGYPRFLCRGALPHLCHRDSFDGHSWLAGRFLLFEVFHPSAGFGPSFLYPFGQSFLAKNPLFKTFKSAQKGPPPNGRAWTFFNTQGVKIGRRLSVHQKLGFGHQYESFVPPPRCRSVMFQSSGTIPPLLNWPGGLVLKPRPFPVVGTAA